MSNNKMNTGALLGLLDYTRWQFIVGVLGGVVVFFALLFFFWKVQGKVSKKDVMQFGLAGLTAAVIINLLLSTLMP